MKIGIPKGLLYYKYYPFINNFFNELGAEIITSEDTNKKILDLGVKFSVDDACLPVKIFHGHVASIKDKCDYIFIPRFMEVDKGQSICPKFCGLPEMVKNSIPKLPEVISEPIYGIGEKKLWDFSRKIGKKLNKNKKDILTAFTDSLKIQKAFNVGRDDKEYKLKIALVGHPYNIYDNFVNMDIMKKLNDMNIGIITEEYIEKKSIDEEVDKLFKRPFWAFARNSYGFATYVGDNKKVDGIIYISSFACGIDSIVIELIKNKLNNFPMLVLKVDEQTGEAGMETRIEAFTDMLERRCS
ncbi:acyl-CoA dehydratase activase-related protein [Clostridium arbusti]|jgi:predicted nucleotide-binding protein (sugar kinase/HSP70/actin superfamily)|uniref:acyl-CoA dehydratase activase-related protein n=2 Tax=Clostridium TaxID=1485 RepID=UPI000289DFB0|nr:acyl-CoA dehydratase activase-related protein [Clostridium arbusti]